MEKVITKSITWEGQDLIFQSGKLAFQADGAVTVTLGKTVILAAVVRKENPSAIEADNFYGLTVNYREKYYAAGKIPGGFLKRESKPSEREVLCSRLIDRCLRPLFGPEKVPTDTYVTCEVLSYDGEYPTEIISILGAYCAAKISGAPLQQEVVPVRVVYGAGEFHVNPTLGSVNCEMEATIGISQQAVIMIEARAQEVDYSIVLQAIAKAQRVAHEILPGLNEFIDEVLAQQKCEEDTHLIKLLADEKTRLGLSDATPVFNEDNLVNMIRESIYHGELCKAVAEKSKRKRAARIKALESVVELIFSHAPHHFRVTEVRKVFNNLKRQAICEYIAKSGLRIDGRQLDEIRPIECLVDYLPMSHGTALFTRGETQVLAAVTIGTKHDELMSDDIRGLRMKNFMLHYNFPPYCTGDAGGNKAPGRREVGHGNLAEKGIEAIMPTKDEFPYTVRVVTDVMSSNGSSSMASVCAASLGLNVAGVPTKGHVAGIAMGAIRDDNGGMHILSDIMGDEDALGEMDCKVAGTRSGVTALQMDVKGLNVTVDMMKSLIDQAQRGLEFILDKMYAAVSMPRQQLSANAPRIVTLQINKEKIRDLIGTGGKVIREICEQSGAKIDIEDTGKVTVSASSQQALEAALNSVQRITADPIPNSCYDGEVTKVMAFGMFVKFLHNTEGLVHVSEIPEATLAQVSSMQGKKVKVRFIGFDKNGKIKLSMKDVGGKAAVSEAGGGDTPVAPPSDTKKRRFF